MDALNQSALGFLLQEDFLSAQEAFRKNAKVNPGLISLNNLGAYYITEGMTLKKQMVRNAKKIGFRLLQSAEKHGFAYENQMALGDFHFNSKEYRIAVDYYNRACKIKQTVNVLRNLGITFYLQEEYVNASLYFEKAISMCKEPQSFEEHGDTIWAGYAYSTIKFDKKKARIILDEIFKHQFSFMEANKFALAYLCGNFDIAGQYADKLFEAEVPDTYQLAMIYDYFAYIGKKEKGIGYVQERIDELNEIPYNTKKKISQLEEMVINQCFREEMIQSYIYPLSITSSCYYIGCLVHKT